MAIDFFPYIDDIRKFAPQIKSDAKLDSFDAFLRPQRKLVVNLISQATYDAIKVYFDAHLTDETATLGKAALYLRGALANLMAIPYFVFEAGERNNTSNSLYRYQEDQQREIYLDNAWEDLNLLISYMDANITSFPGYAATDRRKVSLSLYLKDAAQFNRYFAIGNSAYFFNNCVFIQEEIIKSEVESRIKDYPTITGDDLLWFLGKAIAYRTVAMACLQFDYTELPKVIRNDILKEVGAKKATEAEVKQALAASFNLKANGFFQRVDSQLNEARNADVYTIAEDTLTEDDKFFMPS